LCSSRRFTFAVAGGGETKATAASYARTFQITRPNRRQEAGRGMVCRGNGPKARARSQAGSRTPMGGPRTKRDRRKPVRNTGESGNNPLGHANHTDRNHRTP